VHLPPPLDYITETTYTKAYQARQARPTQLPLQAIQGFKDDGRGRIKIPCHSGLVVIFGNCFGRCHLKTQPLVGLLAFSILPMGWLHANNKPVILGPFSHIKSCMVAHLNIKLYFFSTGFRN
jgi:hypothetical protein